MGRRKAKKKKVKTMITAERLVDKPVNQDYYLDLHKSLIQQIKDAGFTDEELTKEINKIRKDVRRDRSKRKG
jgi:hypothetical protein